MNYASITLKATGFTYTIMDRAVVLLLAGSTRRDQKRVIVKATEYLADYHGRRQHHEPSDTSS